MKSISHYIKKSIFRDHFKKEDMIYFDELLKKSKVMQSPVSKVFAVGGSPRSGGNTDVLIKQITAGLKDENVEFSSVSLGKLEFKGCIGCEKCRRDKICTGIQDGMSTLYPDIIESQGLILASPVHNYNITAWMKAFIDRLYCFYNFDNNTRPRQWSSRLAGQNRKVVIVVVCEQENEEDMGFAIEAMKQPMKALGFEVVGVLPVFLSFEKGAVKKQQEVMGEAYQMGIRLAHSLKEK